MQLGRRAVVDGGIVHGEAVFDIGINFNRMLHACGLECRFESLLFLRREMRIDARDADVNAGAHFRGQEMGAVRLISRQARAMQRSGGGDPVGKSSRGGQRERAAHTVADAADLLADDGW
jgi:hypothetical protein